jgi:hypothetical protein
MFIFKEKTERIVHPQSFAMIAVLEFGFHMQETSLFVAFFKVAGSPDFSLVGLLIGVGM